MRRAALLALALMGCTPDVDTNDPIEPSTNVAATAGQHQGSTGNGGGGGGGGDGDGSDDGTGPDAGVPNPVLDGGSFPDVGGFLMDAGPFLDGPSPDAAVPFP